MQSKFYDDVICNRKADSRFYAVYEEKKYSFSPEKVFLGMVGLVNISLENRSAEISIILDPDIRGKGKGREALRLLLDAGFNDINLDNIYGECYENSAHIGFWEKICKDYGLELYPLPRRKFYKGMYYDSIYFNFTREVFNDHS
jgi:RimJ/RimL family protein N-acetyltransferase